MSNRVAKFFKVSFDQYLMDKMNYSFIDNPEEFNAIRAEYDDLALPERSTDGSAGYDFHSPYDVVIEPGQSKKIYLAVRCQIDPDWALLIMPRSSIGIKKRASLTNTIGLIDSDYYNSDNEGHIIASIDNNGSNPIVINKGDKIVQGVFIPYGLTIDDAADGKRTGGIGSTGV